MRLARKSATITLHVSTAQGKDAMSGPKSAARIVAGSLFLSCLRDSAFASDNIDGR
jgi:hypothetical protein